MTLGQRRHRYCSFCFRSELEVERLITGPGSVSICDECVNLCKEILDKDSSVEPLERSLLDRLPLPKDIYAYLDQYVVGQERAKKILSVAVYNHYKRVMASLALADVELQKSNILLIGPTGCGKTLLAQTLARILDVPFAIGDATTLTEAGYVGEDVENLIFALLQAADNDVACTEKGIIYIDEIDKIARKSGEDLSVNRDISGEGVQQALLRVLEGTIVKVPAKGGVKHPYQKYIEVDTTHILFICGGSFEGIEKLVAQRIKTRPSIGFRSEEAKRTEDASPIELLHQVTTDDLLKFGMIPELVGRLPIIAAVDPLDEEMLVRILTEPKNSIVKQYQKLFELDGVDLVFTPKALQEAAREALHYKTGARALRKIIEETLLEAMYEIPSLVSREQGTLRRCVIDVKAIRNRQVHLPDEDALGENVEASDETSSTESHSAGCRKNPTQGQAA